jgi:hypothetical protein
VGSRGGDREREREMQRRDPEGERQRDRREIKWRGRVENLWRRSSDPPWLAVGSPVGGLERRWSIQGWFSVNPKTQVHGSLARTHFRCSEGAIPVCHPRERFSAGQDWVFFR